MAERPPIVERTGIERADVVETTAFGAVTDGSDGEPGSLTIRRRPAAPAVGDPVVVDVDPATPAVGERLETVEVRYGDDGPTVTGRPASHAFSEPGAYDLSVTLVDADGGETTITLPVVVGETVVDDDFGGDAAFPTGWDAGATAFAQFDSHLRARPAVDYLWNDRIDDPTAARERYRTATDADLTLGGGPLRTVGEAGDGAGALALGAGPAHRAVAEPSLDEPLPDAGCVAVTVDRADVRGPESPARSLYGLVFAGLVDGKPAELRAEFASEAPARIVLERGGRERTLAEAASTPGGETVDLSAQWDADGVTVRDESRGTGLAAEWDDVTFVPESVGLLAVGTALHLRRFVVGDVAPGAAEMTREHGVRDGTFELHGVANRSDDRLVAGIAEADSHAGSVGQRLVFDGESGEVALVGVGPDGRERLATLDDDYDGEVASVDLDRTPTDDGARLVGTYEAGERRTAFAVTDERRLPEDATVAWVQRHGAAGPDQAVDRVLVRRTG